VKYAVRTWRKSSAWYNSPIDEYVSVHCGAKDTEDAKRCEGFEYQLKSRDIKKINCRNMGMEGSCDKYSPYKNEKEGPKYKMKR